MEATDIDKGFINNSDFVLQESTQSVHGTSNDVIDSTILSCQESGNCLISYVCFFTFDLEREFLWNQVRNSNTLLVGTILIKLPEH
jgi:hypothetical protein